ncbi:Mbov_0397 family ICE element conjugal transfer ATPase [Mycoplasma capricolum]|uniref:Mbov_0397 family ICE element conjugal transfer ATPase n=1 Tax=Mycoplasma capricolum TaxID=2095 RepID=UPI003DA1DCD0
MLQPKNIKKTQNLFLKNFTWLDFAVVIIIIILSALIGYTILPINVSRIYKFILSFIIGSILSILLIKSNKYSCRYYILVIRMIKYLFSVKNYDNKKAFTKWLVPYESILENQFVKTKPGRLGSKYFLILRFKGKNPWIEDEKDKDAFLNKFTNLIDSTQFHISFIRKKELSDYTKNFQNLEENFLKKKEYLKQKQADIKVQQNFTTYYENVFLDLNSLDTEFLVDKYYIAVYAKNIFDLKKSIDETISMLNSMEIENEVIKGVELIEFLGALNNKEIDKQQAIKYLNYENENSKQKLAKKQQQNHNDQTFWEFIKSKLNVFNFKKQEKETKNQIKELKLDEILANDNLVFKHNYFIQDGVYCSIHTISKLPLTLPDGWAIKIFDSDSTIVWNLSIFSEDVQAALLDKTGNKMVDNSTLIKSKYFKKQESLQLEALEYLENQLQINRNVLTNSSLMIINSAESLKELRKIEAKNFANAKKIKININPIPFKQFEGLAQACLITTNTLNQGIPMSSYNIAYGWAFENEENNDNNMFILGESDSTGEPIIFNQFYKSNSIRSNYNMFTVGSSGKGKSTDVKKAILANLAQNNRVYIIDPQNEYSTLGREFGASLIDLGLGHNTVINPLEVQILLIEEDGFNENESYPIKSIINNHFDWLEKFFSLINNDWTRDDLVLVMNFVKNLYTNLGLYDVQTIQQLKSFKYPVMSDLISLINNYQFTDEFDKRRKQTKLANILDRLTFDFEYNGKYQLIYNGQTNIDLSNDFIIFNTKNLANSGSGNENVGLYVLLSFIQNQIFNNIIEDPDTNTVLVIDELHKYIDPNNTTTLDFVYTMTKTVRKFNAGMILCTQNPSDFLGSSMITKKAEAILQNCQYAKFFGLKQKDLEAVVDMFRSTGGLNDSHQSYLADSKIGNLIFSLNMYSKIKMSIYYNDFEKELFFTKQKKGEKK